MADLRVVSALVAVAGCLILSQVQSINYIMGTGHIPNPFGKNMQHGQLTPSRRTSTLLSNSNFLVVAFGSILTIFVGGISASPCRTGQPTAW